MSFGSEIMVVSIGNLTKRKEKLHSRTHKPLCRVYWTTKYITKYDASIAFVLVNDNRIVYTVWVGLFSHTL